MQLTEDQIYALEPDEASRKAGRDLATPAKWVTKGINDQTLWGEWFKSNCFSDEGREFKQYCKAAFE